MKKEKKLELNTREKMVKSCTIGKIVLGIVETVLILGVVLLMIFAGSLGVSIYNNEVEIENENIEITEQLPIEIENELTDETELEVLDMINIFVKCVMYILIIDAARRILKNTANDETPFSLKNVKMIEWIDLYIFICWILSDLILGFELVATFLIMSIYQIFKYGYELQKEADETV